jgi:hypothetical protein
LATAAALRLNFGCADVSLRRNKLLRNVLSASGQGIRPGTPTYQEKIANLISA